MQLTLCEDAAAAGKQQAWKRKHASIHQFESSMLVTASDAWPLEVALQSPGKA
jgi:hypothetical protein